LQGKEDDDKTIQRYNDHIKVVENAQLGGATPEIWDPNLYPSLGLRDADAHEELDADAHEELDADAHEELDADAHEEFVNASSMGYVSLIVKSYDEMYYEISARGDVPPDRVHSVVIVVIMLLTSSCYWSAKASLYLDPRHVFLEAVTSALLNDNTTNLLRLIISGDVDPTNFMEATYNTAINLVGLLWLRIPQGNKDEHLGSDLTGEGYVSLSLWLIGYVYG